MNGIMFDVWTPKRSGGVRFALKRLIFPIMTNVQNISPLITRLLAKTSFYNLFVTCIHSVDQQRNSPPKTLTSLSNRVRWG